MEFLEVISLISFLKNFSRMKCWWREEFTAISNNQTQVGNVLQMKEIVRAMEAVGLPKNILCQRYFMFKIIFTNSICICEFFQMNWWKCFTSGAKSWNAGKNCSWIITENYYKVLWGCRTCVGRDLKLKPRTSHVGCFEVVYTGQQNTRPQSG